MSDGPCSPFHYGMLVIDPADAADRLSILHLKREMILDPEAGFVVQDTICRLSVLLDSILDRFSEEVNNRFWELLDELTEINRVQWECEDRVRTECSWAAAQAARTQNSIRVAKKNEIAQLFDFPTEQKLYR